jgi:enoyl-CoA hydratase/carnithine racemase
LSTPPNDHATQHDSAQTVLYDAQEHVARITLNRPDQRNAMTHGCVATLRDHLARAKADDSVRVVVLQGAGDDAFCAGFDLAEVRGTNDFLSNHYSRGAFASIFQDLWQLGKPTVARVQGWALAGGFGLALGCDVLIASEKARFGAPEINVGMWPHMITPVMTRSMPPKVALELVMSGRIVASSEAQRLGFVNQVLPHQELDSSVDEYVESLTKKSPAAMKFGRDTFYSAWDMPAADALSLFRAAITVSSHTEDAAEGIAAFLDKRAPTWSGR